MQGRKSGKEIKHFLNGMPRAGLHASHHPYSGDNLDKNDYYAVEIKSERNAATQSLRRQ